MTDIRVIQANLGHARDGRGDGADTAAALQRRLPAHGSWAILACEAKWFAGKLGGVGGTVYQHTSHAPGDNGRTEIAVITGPSVMVDRAECVKIMDGPHPDTKYQHDRWAWLVWATVDGTPVLFASWHGQANIQRHGLVNPTRAMVRDYGAGTAKLAAHILAAMGGGYAPIVAGDANYRRSLQPWAGSPFRRFKAIGLAVRAHRIDQIATDAVNIAWAREMQDVYGSDGTDHRWLIADLAMKGTPAPTPINAVKRGRAYGEMAIAEWAKAPADREAVARMSAAVRTALDDGPKA